jgi:methylase of polypeptide subunit release factors
MDEAAHGWATRNLAGTGVDLRLGDLGTAFDELAGTVDVVVSNPPYIPLDAWESVALEVRDHDPALALWSGAGRLGRDARGGVPRRPAARAGGVVGSSTPTPRASPHPRSSRPSDGGPTSVTTVTWPAVRDLSPPGWHDDPCAN